MKVSKGYVLPMLLIIALGAIGFGYAWWTEQLVINPGTVNTGDLNVKIVATGTQWGGPGMPLWQPLYFHIKASNVTASWDLSKEIYNPPCPPGAWAGNTLTITIGNLYPHGYTQVGISFPVINIGTIPAKLESVVLTVTSGSELVPYLKYYFGVKHYSARNATGHRTLLWSYFTGGESVPFKDFDELDDELYSALSGRVLMPDEVFSFDGEEGEEGSIGFRLIGTTPNEFEGKSITFTLTFNFKQWNA
jgi:hypothetical protein